MAATVSTAHAPSPSPLLQPAPPSSWATATCQDLNGRRPTPWTSSSAALTRPGMIRVEDRRSDPPIPATPDDWTQFKQETTVQPAQNFMWKINQQSGTINLKLNSAIVVFLFLLFYLTCSVLVKMIIFLISYRK